MTIEQKWVAHGSNRADAQVNLLMFIYAGGSPSFFAPWKKSIDESINLCPILYPGREIRRDEPVSGSFTQMITDFVNEAPELFSKPFVLFGQCTGSIIAYETARCVYEKYNQFPIAFVTSSMNSPRAYDCYKALYDENGNEASDDVLIERMIEQGTVPADFATDRNFVEYYMPIFRGDLKMFEGVGSKAPRPLTCNFYCYSGTEDAFVTDDGLKDWKNYTTKEVYYEQISGDTSILMKTKIIF